MWGSASMAHSCHPKILRKEDSFNFRKPCCALIPTRSRRVTKKEYALTGSEQMRAVQSTRCEQYSSPEKLAENTGYSPEKLANKCDYSYEKLAGTLVIPPKNWQKVWIVVQKSVTLQPNCVHKSVI